MRKALVQLHGDPYHPVSTPMLQQLESHGLIVIENHIRNVPVDFDKYTYLIPKITDAGRKVLTKIDKAFAKPEPFRFDLYIGNGRISIAVDEDMRFSGTMFDHATITISGNGRLAVNQRELEHLIAKFELARDNMKARS